MNYKDRVAIYLRKSRSDDENESVAETLERHNKILTEYAIKNDITIIATYKEVVSGDGLFTRPRMLSLLADIEQDKYTAVLCVDIDRLGRSSTKDSGIIMETMKDHSCRIITPEKVYNLDDDVDEMTVEMKTFFARQELKSIKKRLRRGEIETIKAGGHTGEPPYGYKRIWFNKMPSLEPVPEEAQIIKMIYNWYVNDGFGGTIISDKLNAMGVPAPDGGRFSRSSVMMILSNPVYTGKIVWNRKRRIKKKRPTDKYKEIDNPESEWIIVEGLHESIINEEQWNTAQEIRKSRSHPPSYTGVLRNPYAGIVYCANCGSAIQRQHSNKRFGSRLLCPTTGCNGSLKASLFEERLLLMLQIKLDETKLHQDAKEPPKPDAIDEQIALVRRQINTIKSQRGKLHDFLERGIYDTDTFMERQRILSERQNATEKELKQLQDQRIELIETVDSAPFVPTMEQLLHNWNNIEPAEKNKLLKQLIKRIDYKRDSRTFAGKTEFEINITWRF